MEAPLTAETSFDFDAPAGLRFAVDDTPEEIIRRLRESGGVLTEGGEFLFAANQLEVLRYALAGKETALAELSEHSGLRQWAQANRNSPEAHDVFEKLYQIIHTNQPTPGNEPPAEALAHLLEPEPPSSSPRRRDRIRSRLRPRFGD